MGFKEKRIDIKQIRMYQMYNLVVPQLDRMTIKQQTLVTKESSQLTKPVRNLLKSMTSSVDFKMVDNEEELELPDILDSKSNVVRSRRDTVTLFYYKHSLKNCCHLLVKIQMLVHNDQNQWRLGLMRRDNISQLKYWTNYTNDVFSQHSICFHGRLSDGQSQNAHLKRLNEGGTIKDGDIIYLKMHNDDFRIQLNDKLEYACSMSKQWQQLTNDYTFFIWNGIQKETQFKILEFIIE